MEIITLFNSLQIDVLSPITTIFKGISRRIRERRRGGRGRSPIQFS
jgi:hypothetical protein